LNKDFLIGSIDCKCILNINIGLKVGAIAHLILFIIEFQNFIVVLQLVPEEWPKCADRISTIDWN